MGYIYKITNTVNGKCYVGVTTKENPNERWANHKSAIKYNRGCPLLQKAFKKYGEQSFKFEVLIICFDEDVFKFENDYIVKYNTMSPNGYNVAVGGIQGPSFLGKTHTEETKRQMSIKAKEYNNRPEVKEQQRQRAIEFNKKRNTSEILRNSEKWQQAVREGRIGGHSNTEEGRKKISESLKAYYKRERENQSQNGSSTNSPFSSEKIQKISEILRKVNGKKITQYTKEGIFIASYDSIVEGAEKNGLTRRNVQACVSGYSKTAGGFIWKYTELKDS